MAGLSERLNKEEFIIMPEKIAENILASKKNKSFKRKEIKIDCLLQIAKIKLAFKYCRHLKHWQEFLMLGKNKGNF